MTPPKPPDAADYLATGGDIEGALAAARPLRPLAERRAKDLGRARDTLSRALLVLGAEQTSAEERKGVAVALNRAVPDLAWLAALAPAEWSAACSAMVACGRFGEPLRHLRRAVADAAAPLAKQARVDDRERAQVDDLQGVPEIVVTNRQAVDVVADAWAAVGAMPGPPRLFRREGSLVRLLHGERDTRIAMAGPVHAQSVLIRAARWVQVKRTPEGPVKSECPSPPEFVAADMASMPSSALPVLDSVLYAPCWDADCRWIDGAGYHPSASAWMVKGDDRAAPRMGLEEASALVRDWLADFPFATDADLAHAVALFLLPMLRRTISGPTPLHVVEAPVAGTGKGILVRTLLRPGCGRDVALSPFPAKEEERQKKITAALASGSPVVVWDNVRGNVASPSLEAALTAGVWVDRVLGQTAEVSVPVRCVWAATGNNLDAGTDLARRCVQIRIERKVDSPSDFADFRKPDIAGWTEANAHRLRGAAVAMVEAWQHAGCLAGPVRLGSYEAWSEIVGGVVTHAGFGGWLGNRAAFRRAADPVAEEWVELLRRLWVRHGTEPWAVSDALTLADGDEQRGVPPVLSSVTERASSPRGRVTALGSALSRRRGQVVEGREIQWSILHGVSSYRLADVSGRRGASS